MHDFDTDGQRVAHNDCDATNSGGGYRLSDGGDLGRSGDSDGANSLGWFSPSEWVEYTDDLEQPGVCSVVARTASESRIGVLALTFFAPGASDRSLSGSVPPTGGWPPWQSHSLGTVSIVAGRQVVHLKLTEGAANVNVLQFAVKTPESTSDLWIIRGNQREDRAHYLQQFACTRESEHVLTNKSSSCYHPWVWADSGGPAMNRSPCSPPPSHLSPPVRTARATTATVSAVDYPDHRLDPKLVRMRRRYLSLS